MASRLQTAPSFEWAETLCERFEGSSADELVVWAAGEFGDGFAVASSLGAEDIVLLDVIRQTGVSARVFTLDTGRLPEETHTLLDAVRSEFGIVVEVVAPDAAELAELVQAQGTNGFRQSVDARRRCCDVRKVRPLGRALESATAWATGMRRDQGASRGRIAKVEFDLLNGGKLKLNPLADWSRAEIWERIRTRNLPYNALHDAGYPSVGCAPCTRAVAPGEDERAGRWWWESGSARECGLHHRG